MVLGDYNADCQYVRKSAWDSVKLYTNPAFHWFIPTGTDTAAMASECTFDRAVAKASGRFKTAFVPGSLKVHDFVSNYKIKVAEARQLSDHFPVCLQYD
ncbi:putative Deoxyribonuclease-1 [Hypsibius exemplaris]|uniref:Deoxyribonuclease-1 n=1 Tax=Hypsibius exemplaris TaxID=2072580 RepID=A0A9X6NKR4_HYPEX|nr:putative Deoxyribonuclease-1 [Hypsibius exemplaris]